jgi:hypothetical protein
VEFAAELEARLKEFSATGLVEIRENGGRASRSATASGRVWLRIQRHLQQGDFPRHGYFPGVELQKAPPLVYLVAPARVHLATDILLRYLVNPDGSSARGLGESWRRGLRVVQRQ